MDEKWLGSVRRDPGRRRPGTPGLLRRSAERDDRLPLTWRAVQDFVRSKGARAGYANLIRRRLGSGRYEVVTGVFDTAGARIATQKWEAGDLDHDLTRRFGTADAIEIRA